MVYGQFKYLCHTRISVLWLCSSRINTENAWHLVFAHAASGRVNIKPNELMVVLETNASRLVSFRNGSVYLTPPAVDLYLLAISQRRLLRFLYVMEKSG